LSLGKIYLASLPESEWPAYLRRDEFTAYTDSTVVTGSELRAELADVRDNGFAVDEHEFKPGACCVAAPVYDASKRLIAAIGISVSARRYLRDRDALIEAVQIVARDASSTLPAPLAEEGA
jgi:DNA-binding IclR family transcriptional regulator